MRPRNKLRGNSVTILHAMDSLIADFNNLKSNFNALIQETRAALVKEHSRPGRAKRDTARIATTPKADSSPALSSEEQGPGTASAIEEIWSRFQSFAGMMDGFSEKIRALEAQSPLEMASEWMEGEAISSAIPGDQQASGENAMDLLATNPHPAPCNTRQDTLMGGIRPTQQPVQSLGTPTCSIVHAIDDVHGVEELPPTPPSPDSAGHTLMIDVVEPTRQPTRSPPASTGQDTLVGGAEPTRQSNQSLGTPTCSVNGALSSAPLARRPQQVEGGASHAIDVVHSMEELPADITSESPSAAPQTAPTFSCLLDDIGDELYQKICDDDRAKKYGYAKLSINGLEPLGEPEIQQPGEHDATYFSYVPDGAFTRVIPAHRDEEITFPKFPLPETQKKDWTFEELKRFVDKTLQDREDALYIIGDPLFPDIQLNCGEKLMRRGNDKINGVNTTYSYFNASNGPSLTIPHIEDANLGSINIIRAGEFKVLVVLDPGCNDLFESNMRKEFASSKTCRQFVRHLGRAVSLTKLDEWGVAYDIACFGPAEGFVTLPGPRGVYHMVVNMGSNLAYAINFELKASPDVVLITFCSNWRCGTQDAIEAVHLKLRSTRQSTKLLRKKTKSAPPKSQARSHICIMDSPDQPLPLPPVAMPLVQSGQPPQKIEELIEFAIQYKLFTEDYLSVFRPRKWITGNVLLHLLRIECFGSRFFVVDPTMLDISSPSHTGELVSDRREMMELYDGLVLPFHVKVNDQLSVSGKDHWIVAVLDWRSSAFTAYGMHKKPFESWKASLEAEIQGEKVMRFTSKKLGDYMSDHCCGFLVCFCIGLYLGNYNEGQIAPGPPLRAWYLERLLQQAVAHGTAHLSDVSISLVDLPQTASTPLSSTGLRSCLLQDLKAHSSSGSISFNQLQVALGDDDDSLLSRARILQLVLQCSMPGTCPTVDEYYGVLPDGEIKNILQEIIRIDSVSRRCTVESRIQLSRLGFVVDRELQAITKEMKHAQRIRRREKPDPLRRQAQSKAQDPHSGRSAMYRVLHRLLGYRPEQEIEMNSLRKLNREVKVGTTLYQISFHLGENILYTFPGSIVKQEDMVLKFPSATFKSLTSPIQPSDYDTLNDDELRYFIKWVRILREELSNLKLGPQDMQCFPLAPGKLVPEHIEGILGRKRKVEGSQDGRHLRLRARLASGFK
ncbi:hypothetical protein B0T24DRAFT_628205 [Lasiosphaeria ovina]|uniref:JmjC domain-containing protein n=1 Tax=Lasiosphaeria ovina TaxID=92902 RepID=A0AAE0K734_9PEZI|nr:hypothetical protein B0T24DRAFT_628205 [Lasiosphaeria ovina]